MISQAPGHSPSPQLSSYIAEILISPENGDFSSVFLRSVLSIDYNSFS